MKLLVFAHTPPPHHGQSYMVKLMLEGFGGDVRRPSSVRPTLHGIDCYHVNARLSRDLASVGEFLPAKIFRILWFCLQAIWIRFRHGVHHFYYVPAPGKPVALYRDWVVMLLCRPFFKQVILHWHAAGLHQWLETSAPPRVRAITYRLFRPVDLSIVISRYNLADAENMASRRIRLVDNGIPDPCPDFDQTIRPRRERCFALRRQAFEGTLTAEPLRLKVLFLTHCTRQKGLFAAAEAVLLANRNLTDRQIPMQLQLLIAGNFVTAEERLEFNRLYLGTAAAKSIVYVGFVSGTQKDELLSSADLFLFPSRYLGETQSVCLIEAMAFGLPIVTTRWRCLPEMLPVDYAGLADDQDPGQLAAALLRVLATESGLRLRRAFLDRFELQPHLTALAAALRSVEED